MYGFAYTYINFDVRFFHAFLTVFATRTPPVLSPPTIYIYIYGVHLRHFEVQYLLCACVVFLFTSGSGARTPARPAARPAVPPPRPPLPRRPPRRRPWHRPKKEGTGAHPLPSWSQLLLRREMQGLPGRVWPVLRARMTAAGEVVVGEEGRGGRES